MGSRKRPHDETIESGRLQELSAYVNGTNSFVVIILNSFLLPITEEARVGTSQRTFRTCVRYCSKFEQEPSAFIKVLTKWSPTRT